MELFESQSELTISGALLAGARPGTLESLLDNRMQSYRFFARSFGLTVPEAELLTDGEIKSREELAVGLPEGNLTILGLARVYRSQAVVSRSRAVATVDFEVLEELPQKWNIEVSSHNSPSNTMSARPPASTR